MAPLARDAGRLLPALLGPLRPPRHPVPFARFGLSAVRSAAGLARVALPRARARRRCSPAARRTRCSASSSRSRRRSAWCSRCSRHAVGWPIARGGSQSIADALAAHLRSLGGEIRTASPVESVDELPAARALLLDLTPRQVLRVAGGRLPGGYRRALGALPLRPGRVQARLGARRADPVDARRSAAARGDGARGRARSRRSPPPSARWPRAGVRAAVRAAGAADASSTRAARPRASTSAWAYCHVPHGFGADMTERIEAQIERFAPGFRDLVLGPVAPWARRTWSATTRTTWAATSTAARRTCVQLFARPVPRLVALRHPGATASTSARRSTPPGGGVHGMCGYHAARAALRRSF